MLDVCLVCSAQSDLSVMQSQMSDVTMQPSSEQQQDDDYDDDEEEDEDEEVDEDWAWGSGDLTKKYNRTSVNSQVRPLKKYNY